MDCNEKLVLAEELELQGDFESAKTLYINLLSQQGPEIGKIYFEFARFLFRQQHYAEALQMLVKAYEEQYEQEEILTIIDEAYYLPNLQTLQKRFKMNVNALKRKVPSFEAVSFNALQLKFIPCTDSSYYIFSLETKTFLGVFNEDAQIDKETIVELFPFIINVCASSVLIDILEKANNQKIFLVYENIDKFIPFLQIISTEIIADSRAIFVFTVCDVVNYWRAYGPKRVINLGEEEGDIAELIRFQNRLQAEDCAEKIREVYHFRQHNAFKNKETVQTWRKCKKDSLLSFCIPTYNRGSRALACVEHILRFSSEQIEVVVFDNGSEDPEGAYQRLAQIKDSRLHYFRNNENVGFAKNWYKTMEYASGKYVFILSDEDLVNLDSVPALLERLKHMKGISAIRGSMKPAASGLSNVTAMNVGKFTRGFDALVHCAFYFSYISGSIYNRERIISNKLFERLACNLEKHAIYPHLFLEALLCTAGDYLVLSDILVFEGKAESSSDSVMNPNSLAYSYEGRVTQHNLFTEAITEAYQHMKRKNENELAILYLNICSRLVNAVIRINGWYYKQQGRDVGLLIQDSYYQCLATAGALFNETYIKKELALHIRKLFQPKED